MHLTSQFKSDLYVFHHEYMTRIMMVFFVFVNTVSNGQLSSKFTWKGKKIKDVLGFLYSLLGKLKGRHRKENAVFS